MAIKLINKDIIQAKTVDVCKRIGLQTCTTKKSREITQE
jgi:hypothetical protein